MQTFKFKYFVKSGFSKLPDASFNHPNTLIFCFAEREVIDEQADIVKKLVEAFPKATVVGCSTAGNIDGTVMSTDHFSLMALRLESGRLFAVTKSIKQASDSFEAGKFLADTLLAHGEDLKGVVILSEGLNINGSHLVEGFQASGKKIPMGGGLSGDGTRFEMTYTLLGDKFVANQIVAIGFYGNDIHFSVEAGSGWDKFGPDRRVTKSIGNVLYELDDAPALDLYKSYLGDKAANLPSSALNFPLLVHASGSDKESCVRTILGIDNESKTMTFAADIPVGSRASLMRCNFDRLVDGSASAAARIMNNCNKHEDTVFLAFSCVGRRVVLADRLEEELEAICSGDPQIPVFGFYSYGEIAPFENSSRVGLHNETMTIVRITEK